jgi:hypothetical protein
MVGLIIALPYSHKVPFAKNNQRTPFRRKYSNCQSRQKIRPAYWVKAGLVTAVYFCTTTSIMVSLPPDFTILTAPYLG